MSLSSLAQHQASPLPQKHNSDKSLQLHEGIGKQVAISFAKEGCTKLALFDQDEAGLAQTKKDIAEASKDAEVYEFKVDVRSSDDVIKTMTQVIAHFGRIDYAVNCAGV